MGNVEEAKAELAHAVFEREIQKQRLNTADRYVMTATEYLIELLSR